MPFQTALGALLGGATEEAARVHQERFQQEQADRKFAFDTLTHLIDDPNIGNPQVKEEALQELHGRMMGSVFPDHFTHKTGKLGKLVDQFIGMQRPQGPIGPMSGGGSMQQGQQTGVGTGNAKPTQLGGTMPPPPQDGAPQAPADGSGDPTQSPMNGMLSPDQTFGPQDITASGFMSPNAQATTAANRQAQLDQVKFQKDYEVKEKTWKWLTANDPEIQKMGTEERNLEHGRFMYGLVTPVSYFRQEQSKDDISFEQATALSKQSGVPMPDGARPGMYFRADRNIAGVITKINFGTTQAPVSTGTISNPSSPTGFSRDFVPREDPQNPVASFAAPAPFAQTPYASMREEPVTLADGTVIKTSLSSIRGPAADIQKLWQNRPSSIGFDPSSAVSKDNLPPGSTIIGTKNVPDFIPKMDGNRNAMLNTMELAMNFQKEMPKIASLIDRGKLALALDPNSPAGIVANQVLPWSQEESETVANMMSLAEHINTLRGPLGATGFRGAEAFAALQNQRGNLMANSEITTALLNNTLKALTSQIGAETKSLTPAGRKFPDHYKPMILDVYKQLYGAGAIQKLRDDGF